MRKNDRLRDKILKENKQRRQFCFQMWISNYLFPIQCVYMWSQHKWPGEGNAALLVDFIKTWVLKFLEPQHTWEVFSSASSHTERKQSLREMCGTQTSGGGWCTGQFTIHRRKKRKKEERKEAKEKRERDVKRQTGRQRRRQRERGETPAVRDRPALTEGRQQGSHSHSCHNLK